MWLLYTWILQFSTVRTTNTSEMFCKILQAAHSGITSSLDHVFSYEMKLQF